MCNGIFGHALKCIHLKNNQNIFDSFEKVRLGTFFAH